MANRDPKTGRFIKESPTLFEPINEDDDDSATKAALIVSLVLILLAVVAVQVL